jgi:hypothetical protein
MPHKKTPTKSAKTTARKTPNKSGVRKLKQPKYRPLRFKKNIKPQIAKLPSSFKLFKLSFKHLWTHKKLFAGITTVYLILTLILVRGFVFTSDLGVAKQAIQELLSGSLGQIASSLTVLGILLGTNTPSGQAASVYQSVIVIMMSLVLIWALRQTHAHIKVTVKESFYKSMYPLVQFTLVLLMIGLQLLPMLAASFLFNATVASGLAGSGLEKLIWVTLSFLLLLWSIYMVSASIFALYIVTLPDMLPRKALKSAKGLVQFRRWTIMRKVVFLPFAVSILGVLIMLPIIMLLTPVAEIIFLFLGAAVLAIVHSYMYSLYRELL